MLVGRSVVQSVDRFNRELDSYFDTSRKCRCKLRNGSILIVDSDERLHCFLKSIIEQCGLKINIVRVGGVQTAKDLVRRMEKDLKVVIVDTAMLDLNANGKSLPSWIDKNFPKLPIWVSNCSPERVGAVRELSARAGILESDHPMSEYVDILGLPLKARGFVEKFAG